MVFVANGNVWDMATNTSPVFWALILLITLQLCFHVIQRLHKDASGFLRFFPFAYPTPVHIALHGKQPQCPCFWLFTRVSPMTTEEVGRENWAGIWFSGSPTDVLYSWDRKSEFRSGCLFHTAVLGLVDKYPFLPSIPRNYSPSFASPGIDTASIIVFLLLLW